MNTWQLRLREVGIRWQRFFAQRRRCCARAPVLPAQDLGEILQRTYGAYDPFLTPGRATHGAEHLQAIIDGKSRHPATEHDIALYLAAALWTSGIGDRVFLGTLYFDFPGQPDLTATPCVFLDGADWFLILDNRVHALTGRDQWPLKTLELRRFSRVPDMRGGILHEVIVDARSVVDHVDFKFWPV